MRTRRKGRVDWKDAFPSLMTPKKPKPACQCEDPFQRKACAKEIVPGSVFCKDHQGCPGSPQSGYEPSYEQDSAVFNQPPVQKSHNCYSWAMRYYDPISVELCKKNGNCRRYFPQPGALHGDRNALNVSERRTCKEVERLIKADNPNIQKTTFYQKCPKGMSKIALVVDEGEDYHFYVQEKGGRWSHKDGSNNTKWFDALKLPIHNPKLAARDYRYQNTDLNYDNFCGFYCVPRDGTVRLGRGGRAAKRTRRSQQSRRSRQSRRH
jgi:hypothetical protein